VVEVLRHSMVVAVAVAEWRQVGAAVEIRTGRSSLHCSRPDDDRQASQRQGRRRRTGSGRAHDRLLNRHAVLRGSATGPSTLARGHNASLAATIAAASSSVGTADPDTLNDTLTVATLRALTFGSLVVNRPTGAIRSSHNGAGGLIVEGAP
jgi:hypothetical protein